MSYQFGAGCPDGLVELNKINGRHHLVIKFKCNVTSKVICGAYKTASQFC